jgi:hypothetical protein
MQVNTYKKHGHIFHPFVVKFGTNACNVKESEVRKDSESKFDLKKMFFGEVFKFIKCHACPWEVSKVST